ncbi:apelin receptor early endogenous ligand [Mobula birostris]|uniref:apelin receptor early endogenous ligand n=1 Tax=Mobula birostris TaxID=1983395 RepID=UPI003B28C2BD
MRFQHFFYIILVVCTSLLLINGQKAGKQFQWLRRRKMQRHNCLQRRCMPLHSRVPFP